MQFADEKDTSNVKEMENENNMQKELSRLLVCFLKAFLLTIFIFNINN